MDGFVVGAEVEKGTKNYYELNVVMKSINVHQGKWGKNEELLKVRRTVRRGANAGPGSKLEHWGRLSEYSDERNKQVEERASNENEDFANKTRLLLSTRIVLFGVPHRQGAL